MENQLNKLILLVKAEIELLKLCEAEVTQAPVAQMIARNKERLSQEVKSLDQIIKVLESRGPLNVREQERLDSTKLNISKLLLQNEKIFSSEEQFKDIVGRVPKLSNQEHSFESMKPGPPRALSRNEQNYSFQKGMMTMTNNKWSTKSDKISKSKLQQQPQEVNEVQQQYQIVRSNIDQLLHEMNNLNCKIDTHKHEEYQKQIDKLKEENSKLKADYQMLRQDNTELLFLNNDIKRMIEQLEQENQQIFEELAGLREVQYHPQPTGQSRLSNYYIPYDEQKGHEAEQILSRLKQQ